MRSWYVRANALTTFNNILPSSSKLLNVYFEGTMFGGGGLNQMSWKLAQMSFSDNRCHSSVCTLFSFLSSPEPLGQFQPHLAQSILYRRRGYAGERYEPWAYCLFVFVFWGRGWLYTYMMVLPCKHMNRHRPQMKFDKAEQISHMITIKAYNTNSTHFLP